LLLSLALQAMHLVRGGTGRPTWCGYETFCPKTSRIFGLWRMVTIVAYLDPRKIPCECPTTEETLWSN
jgi:hypothetical protein